MPNRQSRLIAVDLDEATIRWRSADIEQERRVAIFDLLDQNHFEPRRAGEAGHAGPYRLRMRVSEGRLALDIHDEHSLLLESVILGLASFRRVIRDYFAICESYHAAIRDASPSQIETIDMARRGLHNEAAGLLIDRLDGKVVVDFDTARRLFTLICVLHLRAT
jgi:uncharacterized protein (UPF0262 family)